MSRSRTWPNEVCTKHCEVLSNLREENAALRAEIDRLRVYDSWRWQCPKCLRVVQP